jgi:hypothetical protein
MNANTAQLESGEQDGEMKLESEQKGEITQVKEFNYSTNQFSILFLIFVIVTALTLTGALLLLLSWYDERSLNIKIVIILMLASFVLAISLYLVPYTGYMSVRYKRIVVIVFSFISIIGMSICFSFGLYFSFFKKEVTATTTIEYVKILFAVAPFIMFVHTIGCYYYIRESNGRSIKYIGMVTIQYNDFAPNRNPNMVANDDACSICITKYENKDKIIQLICKHYFHEKCITPWINNKGTCPLCRLEIKLSK